MWQRFFQVALLFVGDPIHLCTFCSFRPPTWVACHRYFGACRQKGVVPSTDCARDGGLGRLRTVLSTGSPLLPEHFQWIYEVVKTMQSSVWCAVRDASSEVQGMDYCRGGRGGLLTFDACVCCRCQRYDLVAKRCCGGAYVQSTTTDEIVVRYLPKVRREPFFGGACCSLFTLI